MGVSIHLSACFKLFIRWTPLSVTGLRDAEASMEFVFECFSERVHERTQAHGGLKLFEASESWKPVTLMGGKVIRSF